MLIQKMPLYPRVYNIGSTDWCILGPLKIFSERLLRLQARSWAQLRRSFKLDHLRAQQKDKGFSYNLQEVGQVVCAVCVHISYNDVDNCTEQNVYNCTQSSLSFCTPTCKQHCTQNCSPHCTRTNPLFPWLYKLLYSKMYTPGSMWGRERAREGQSEEGKGKGKGS